MALRTSKKEFHQPVTDIGFLIDLTLPPEKNNLRTKRGGEKILLKETTGQDIQIVTARKHRIKCFGTLLVHLHMYI